MKAMGKIRHIASALAFAGLCTFASAQNMRTGYFMDGYAYKFKMNPAMTSSRSFVALSALGNLNLGVDSNLGLSSIYYPKQDGSGLTTFLNSEVDAATAMSKFSKKNYANFSTDLSLVSVGFWGKSGKMYHNIDISYNMSEYMSAPYDLFRFAKEGSANGNNVFDLGGTRLSGDTYLSVAYGFSLPIVKNVRFGARAKLLLGLASVDASLKGTSIKTGADEWYAVTDGTLAGNLPLNMKLPVNEKGYVDWEKTGSDFDIKNIGSSFGSIGAAVDLGVTVDFLEDFTASASVTDLGFIAWNNYLSASAAKGPDGNPKKTVIASSSESTDFSKVGDKLLECLDFTIDENGVKKATMLRPTVFVGLQYRMPFYRRMSVGVLSTTKIAGSYTWSEGRLSVNLDPTDWFSFSTNYAYSTFGHSAGVALSFHLTGFNFFLGTDSYVPLLNVTPQFVPINRLNTSITCGFNIMFGRYNGRYASAE